MNDTSIVPQRPARPNLFADTPTSAILAEAECWLWDLTQFDADIKAAPDSWDFPDQNRAFIEMHIEEAEAELARRERLRHRPGAPPWPDRWPDRRAELERIRDGVDLPALIERWGGVTLQRRGGELVCSCPLPGHDDRTPSFTVNQEKRLFHCFGCGRGGDVFAYAMHQGGTHSFAEAVAILAEEVGRG